MNRCDRKVDMAVAGCLSGAGVAAAGAAARNCPPEKADASPPLARLRYPANRLANVSDLKPDEEALQVLSGHRARRASC